MTDEPEYWYRYEVKRVGHWDDDYEVITSWSYTGGFIPFRVPRHTPKGVWVKDGFRGEAFVRGASIRQLCVPTKELAVKDEIARRKRHVEGAKHRLTVAEDMLAYAKRKGGDL